MVSVTTLPELRTGPITRAERDSLPDDGRRYELIDGVLIVSTAPRPRHQRALLRLAIVVDAACPAGFELLPAPLDVTLADDTVMEPDLVVGRDEDFSARGLEAAPVLAVEITSPSTRLIDLDVKRPRLERAGCAHFWFVDPDVPSITVWELVDGVYVQTAYVEGKDELVVERPFPVTVVPSRLVSPRH